MTHFGENTEFIEDDPVKLMLPSDSTETVSILNYGPPKFLSYENSISQSNPRKKTFKFYYSNPLLQTLTQYTKL